MPRPPRGRGAPTLERGDGDVSTTLPSKELSELQRRFKPGYTVEQAKGGHFRVLDPDGEPVRINGKPFMLPSSPHGGRATKNAEAALIRLGVLKQSHSGSYVPMDPELARERRQRGVAKTLANRQANRQREAKALKLRLDPIVERAGGWKQPGNISDLAHLGAEIARERGEIAMTPDLLTSSATRVRDTAWVEQQYQAVWNALAERIEEAEDPIEAYYTLLRKARHLPGKDELVVSQLRLIDGEWPFEVVKLELEQLFVDHSYQRPPAWPFIRKTAATFDETLVGAIDVSERAGGKHAIMDGQLRYEAMRLIGKKTCWAAVYLGLNQAAEARFFLRKNRDRKAVHTYWTFRAQVIAGEEEAIAIEKIVKSYGYRIFMTSAGGAHDERNISAIAACQDAYRRSSETRKECLSPTLAVMKASTFGRKQGQASTLIRGLGRFFQLNDEVELEKLSGAILSSPGPEWLLGKARDEAGGSGSAQMPAMARVLTNLYNKEVGAKQRLPLP